jgi:tRNA G37 N-methylase Trm5
MIDLLELHKYFILNHLHEGDVAVDFTMGNGHDTEFLCRTVGETGRVYAFDIQAQAVESTRQNLEAAGVPQNYTLIHDSHHNVKNYVKEPFKAGMFNLGWLPGGDKSITTLRETTMPAIEAAIDLMDRDAILNIAVYPGHAEGDAEGKMICDYLASISRHKVCATRVNILNSPTSPYFIVVETKPNR